MMIHHSRRAAPSCVRPASRFLPGPLLPLHPLLRLLGGLALLWSLACGAPAPEVEFDYELAPEGSVSAPSGPAVESGGSEITVRRIFMASGACRTLEADLVRPDPGQLVLRISAVRGDPDCEDRSRAFRYSATLRDLREGRYNLQVVHSTFDNGRRNFETVLDHPVLVTR